MSRHEEETLVHVFKPGQPVTSHPARRRTDPRPFDEALDELIAERDALKALVGQLRDAKEAIENKLEEARSHSAHISALYGRQIQEIALLRTFYARQDATSWAAVREFDAKGPAL
jgi:predicted RNase H-like nuclease (RuvC/YqgF family)